jgi:hypothetical protein
MSDEDYSGEWWYQLWRDSCEKREQQRRNWRRLLFQSYADPRQPDPLRDCNYLLSLPHVTPSKAYRN